MVAPLDDVNGVDLHIAEMFDRGPGGRGAIAERRRRGEPLGVQSDALGVRPGQGMGFGCVVRHRAALYGGGCAFAMCVPQPAEDMRSRRY